MKYNETAKLDDTGKVILDGIYNNSDPRNYYSTLQLLDYSVPQEAKPYFERILRYYRAATGTRDAKVVDLGCSYGVNAALLKCGMTLDQLYELYGSRAARSFDREALIARDRRVYAANGVDPHLEVVGVDTADRAAAYAVEADILDGAVAFDFEAEMPENGDLDALEGSDLIISTGCIGYITGRTIERTLEASGEGQPWMAHFVLRMFPFEPIRETLAGHGYVTARGRWPVRQRRFACEEEREQVLDRLAEQGIDPSGLESEGWLYAELYVSRPLGDAALVPAAQLVAA